MYAADSSQEKLEAKVNSKPKTRITNEAPLSLSLTHTARHNTSAHTSAERSIKDRHSTAHPETAHPERERESWATRPMAATPLDTSARTPPAAARRPRVDREPKPTDLASTHARTARPRGICARTGYGSAPRHMIHVARELSSGRGSPHLRPPCGAGGLEEHSRREAGDGREGGSRRGRGREGGGGRKREPNHAAVLRGTTIIGTMYISASSLALA